MTRIFTIMGSGETAPTMVKVHRSVMDRLGPAPVPAVFLDTPFGFQANAPDLVDKTRTYFRESVGHEIGVASFLSHAVIDDSLAYETALTRIREARYVFAGPGSPSYALRSWAGTRIPAEISARIAPGAAGPASPAGVTFASAAALTLGVATIPVYEIYKVGEDARWLDGLNILQEVTGLLAAVIPHYDNAEGGHHDTRFCYLGEHRLCALEDELPDGAFVLGVDEHTALVMDLDSGTATVNGRGGVTIRSHGRSTVFPTGTEISIENLRPGAAPSGGSGGSGGSAGSVATPAVQVEPTADRSPLLESVANAEATFAAALTGRDVDAAVRAILDLDAELAAWANDVLESDEADQGRAAVRSMIVRLGELARVGATNPRTVVGPFVETLLDVRTAARKDRQFTLADTIRDRVVALGIEVRDGPTGTEWDILSP